MSHSLPRKYLKKLISNFVSLMSGFVVTSLVPRALGPLEFGKFSYITDIFSQIFVLLEGGSSNALYNKLSQDPKHLVLFKKYTRFLIFVNILIFAGVIISIQFDLSTFLFSGLETKFILMGLIYASLFWLNSIYMKVLDGIGQTTQMEQQRIYMSIFRAGGVISLFFANQISLMNFFIFQITLVLLLNFSFFKLIRNFNGPVKSNSTENAWSYFIKYSSPLFFYGVISATATIADRWMLQRYSGLSHQGYFSLASQLGAICFLFSSSLTPLFHREIAITSHKNDIKGSQALIYRSFPVLFFVAAIMGIFGAVNAPALVELIGGTQFKDQILAYSLMFLYPIHQTYGQLAGSIYYASGETKLYRNIGTILIITGIATSFVLLAPSDLLGMNLGFMGIAIKNVGLQLFNVHILLFFAFRKLKLRLSPFVLNQIAIICLLGIFAFGAKLISDHIFYSNIVLNLVSNALIYFTLLGVLLIISYKLNLPILMRYTQENIKFVSEKIASRIVIFK